MFSLVKKENLVHGRGFVLHINKVALSIFFKVCWASQPVDSIDCASSLKHQKTTVWIDGLVNLFSVFELSVQTLADNFSKTIYPSSKTISNLSKFKTILPTHFVFAGQDK